MNLFSWTFSQIYRFLVSNESFEAIGMIAGNGIYPQFLLKEHALKGKIA